MSGLTPVSARLPHPYQTEPRDSPHFCTYPSISAHLPAPARLRRFL